MPDRATLARMQQDIEDSLDSAILRARRLRQQHGALLAALRLLYDEAMKEWGEDARPEFTAALLNARLEITRAGAEP